ncbi:hypothetical protein [Coprococcus sp. RTP21281st1_F1_RTP21281_210402]|uniref:hypothetical protein n=1 Tax=Coprococcus sp. RTP21281st1_F1_RTP21281_210402 TaxID=3143208 RepID=UPI0034A2AB4A
MQKDSKDAEIIFTYRLVDGTKYGLSTGTKCGICTKEFYDFDSVEEIETLMLGLADMLNKIRLEHNGKFPRW